MILLASLSEVEFADIITASLELVLSTMLLTAAIMKALDLTSWSQALENYKLPILPRRLVVIAVPVAESIIGIGLLAGLEPAAAEAATVLFICFGVVLSIAFARGSRGECDCFGQLFESAIGPRTILRAFVLASASLLLLSMAQESRKIDRGVVIALAAIVTAALIVVAELRVFYGKARRGGA